MADRQQAVLLINEACTAGARQHKACEVLDITQRTYQRWSHPEGCVDKRLEAVHMPAHQDSDHRRFYRLLLNDGPGYRTSLFQEQGP